MAIILCAKHIIGLWAFDGFVPPIEERTKESYRQKQISYVLRNPAILPRTITAPINAFIGGGVWRVHCVCREVPHTDPMWGISCCFGCGATYETVIFPSNYQEIEDLLSKRPLQLTRNWESPETLASLIVEQIEHGDPV